MDRELGYPFILSCYSERLGFDLLSYFLEVCEATIHVEKLRVLGVWVTDRRWRVDELKHQWPSSDNPLTSREEIATNNAI